MKKLFLFIFLLIPLLIYSQTPVSPGPVSGTWGLNGSPYNVNGEIYIEATSTLIIEPGVEVIFTGWYKFIVYGSLLAEGTEDAYITFTCENISVNWRGIRFTETDKTSILDYCIVEHGRALGGTPDNSGGGICCYNSPNASIIIKNSVLRDNQAWFGGGISCDSTDVQIENCEITDNTGQLGGGLYFRVSNPVLTDCLIAYNYAVEDGGAAVCSEGCVIELYGNTIIHNISELHAGAIDFAYSTDAYIENNLFAHNRSTYGGAISFYHSFGNVLKNNTWANNKGLNRGGVIYFWNGSSSHTNDIFYFNEAGQGANPNQFYLGTGDCNPDFFYCNIQDSIAGFSGDTLSYTGTILNCIDSDPLFGDTLNDDYNITWQNYPVPDSTMSLCIDRGEPGFIQDPDGTRQDIGAYPFFQQLDVPIAYEAQEIGPNSFIAVWSNSFGYGYNLDVAMDEAFTNFQYENIYIEGDTSYLVEELEDLTNYYYRVRSYNYDTVLVSTYSDIIPVITTSIEKYENHAIEIFSSNNQVHININRDIKSPGEIWIYSLSGQLIAHDQIYSGTNLIDPKVTDQMIIVKAIIDKQKLHKKLFIH